jgi:hypothetical protein
MSESIQALRRANPRATSGFAESVDAAADAVRARIAGVDHDGVPRTRAARGGPRARLVRVSAAGASLATAAVVAVALTVGSPGGTGVEDAAAAVKRAATLTAATAERSGTVVVRITHGGEAWAGTTVRWNGEDISVSRDSPRAARKAGSELRVVGGILYGIDPGFGDWVELGDPAGIDPDSGTTPAEYLAVVREDVGGTTLQRLTGGMTGLTTRRLEDGSTVYSGTVAAGLVARETGFKEGEALRVLPFGYVAHDEASDPDALLDAAVTVGADGVVREIDVRWGASGSLWRFTVTYSELGATPAPVAPESARPMPRRSHSG